MLNLQKNILFLHVPCRILQLEFPAKDPSGFNENLTEGFI